MANIVSNLTNDFEDILENMELDEDLLRDLVEIMNDDNMVQTSKMESMAIDVLPVNETSCDSSNFSDYEAQLVFDDEKHIQNLDHWVSQNIVELGSTFPGLTYENEMMPFWHVENPVKEDVIDDDIVYVDLWGK
ncbi:hypothetical protein R6Q59_002621 [Mikania micrantha]|uniref:Uncharacterized protein n=1 Tax=Mikania micrantha TaxID=192012 RepID=A0A5N6NNU5_9ASTR|nr:hypothetical protein E3N88_19642 [Mikania micrantha]